MATGSLFEGEFSPKIAVQVGLPGDIGIIPIQDMLFSVRPNRRGGSPGVECPRIQPWIGSNVG